MRRVRDRWKGTTAMMQVTDRLIAPSRVTAEDAIAALDREVGGLGDHDRTFARALEAACNEVGIDFTIAYSHCGNETNLFTDDNWNVNLNPAGIGIDGVPGHTGPVFPNATASARFYVALLLLKINKGDDVGAFEAEQATAPTFFDGTRAFAQDPTFPTVTTLDDLRLRFGPNDRECVWMCDQSGPLAIVEKATRLFPNGANLPTGGPVTVTTTPAVIDYSSLPFPVHVNLIPSSQPNQNPDLPLEPVFVTIHETGSPDPANDTALGEENYVRDGAPDENGNVQQLSVHFFVDAHEARQIIALNRVAWHAGDNFEGPGNRTALAIETVIEPNGLPQARANVRALTALLIRTLPGLAPKGINAVVQHNHWSGKDCPQICRNTPGCWEEQIAQITALLAAGSINYPNHRVAVGGAGVVNFNGAGDVTVQVQDPNEFVCIHGTTFRTYPNRDAPAGVKTPAQQGKNYRFGFKATVDGEKWLVSKAGSWGLASAFEERN
jgi:N-acetylmuramoyl-L-alanine amidase